MMWERVVRSVPSALAASAAVRSPFNTAHLSRRSGWSLLNDVFVKTTARGQRPAPLGLLNGQVGQGGTMCESWTWRVLVGGQV